MWTAEEASRMHAATENGKAVACHVGDNDVATFLIQHPWGFSIERYLKEKGELAYIPFSCANHMTLERAMADYMSRISQPESKQCPNAKN